MLKSSSAASARFAHAFLVPELATGNARIPPELGEFLKRLEVVEGKVDRVLGSAR